MSDDDIWGALIVAGVLITFVVMATCTGSCSFTAYESCMRSHPTEPQQCEKLLPKGWQR